MHTTLKFVKPVDVTVATDPDTLPARILQKVAHVISAPLTILCKRILQEKHWPKLWRYHHLVPIYKRKFLYDANNYRGVHITSNLSKVAERVIGAPMLNYFARHESFGIGHIVAVKISSLC